MSGIAKCLILSRSKFTVNPFDPDVIRRSGNFAVADHPMLWRSQRVVLLQACREVSQLFVLLIRSLSLRPSVSILHLL